MAIRDYFNGVTTTYSERDRNKDGKTDQVERSSVFDDGSIKRDIRNYDPATSNLLQDISEKVSADGAITRDITHYNPGGTECTVERINISADGKTTTVARDNENDGHFDQLEVVANVDGASGVKVGSQQLGDSGDTGYSTMLLDADTGQVLGAVRVADAVLPENDLPDAASPSSTLSFTQAMFEAERFFAGDAHEIRSFVGLETPLLGGDDTLSGDGSAATTVWLREFDTFIGPQVIDDTLAELQADWSVGTDGSAAQGTSGYGTTDSPTLDIEGLYALDLSWINPANNYLQPPAFDLDLDFGYTYEAPKLYVWDFTQDTGFNYLGSGSDVWDMGGSFNADLGSPYSNYDLFDSYSHDLFGLGSVLTFDLGGSDSFDLGGYSSGWDSGYSYGLGGGFSLDLGGGFDFSVGDYGPVVLDLDGDGIELVAAGDSRAWYDLDGHGARFHTGWVGMDDALLAIDDNGDGEISSGREIAFSLYTEADETDTDMEALATVFDTNADGRLDFNDARYAEFRLWQDANGNGESDTGEVRTLEEAGIASVDLVPVKVDYRSGGNRLLGFSSYEKADGGTNWAGDVSFGFEGDGYATSVENGYLRVKQLKGQTFGIGTGGAVNLDLTANDLDGVLGNDGADILLAGSTTAGILLEGGNGADNLSGGVGDDWLAGGAGADVIRAGVGNDTLLIDSADLQANLDGGDGFDTALVSTASGVNLDLGAARIEAAVGG